MNIESPNVYFVFFCFFKARVSALANLQTNDRKKEFGYDVTINFKLAHSVSFPGESL